MNGMNESALRICRVLCLLLSAMLCAVAVILLTIGVATPSWLWVDYRVADGVIEEHRHGLWLDCMLKGASLYSQSSSYFNWAGMTDQCEYKWVNLDPYTYGGAMDPYGSGYGTSGLYETDFAQHRFLAWHVSILVLLLIAITAGVFAVFACICVLCTGLCSPVAALLEFVAFLCSAIGCVVFFINANRPEIRWTQIPHSVDRSRFYQQTRGFSFDLSVASVFLFLLSFLVGLIGSAMVFMHAHRRHERRHRMASKTYPTTVTTVSSAANDHGRMHDPGTSTIRTHSPGIDV